MYQNFCRAPIGALLLGSVFVRSCSRSGRDAVGAVDQLDSFRIAAGIGFAEDVLQHQDGGMPALARGQPVDVVLQNVGS